MSRGLVPSTTAQHRPAGTASCRCVQPAAVPCRYFSLHLSAHTLLRPPASKYPAVPAPAGCRAAGLTPAGAAATLLCLPGAAAAPSGRSALQGPAGCRAARPALGGGC